MLDARTAFDGQVRGERARPRELGMVVPSGEPTRPIYSQPVDPLLIPFITTFIDLHPTIWDMMFYRGYVLVADETGGFYSYQFAGDRPRIRLRVRPRVTAAGRRTRFSFVASAVRGGRRERVAGATIRFAGRSVRTDSRGRAAASRTLRRVRRYRATAKRSGYLPGSASVRAVRVRVGFTG